MNARAMPESHGKFRLVAELGRGGMGNVYLAVLSGPAGFNKLQVVKRLRTDLAEDQESVTMFLDEARLAARLNHPNVVQTNEVGNDGSHYFIAMEYLEGQSLDQLARRAQANGGISLGIQLRILCDALTGLHYAHELADFDGTPLGLVHRDVTPHNIFVTYDGNSKLLDFGIAKAATSAHETRAGTFKGKCAYMSAEQIVGDPIDRRADLFSLGAVLWQACTGQRLWKGETDIKIFHRVVSGDIPSPRTVNPNVPEQLEEICMKALARNRDDRFATALDMQAALEDFIADSGMKATHRDVATFVTRLFATERTAIKAAVDAQLRDIMKSSEPLQLAAIPVLGRTGDEGGTNRPGSGPRDASSLGSLSIQNGMVFGGTASQAMAPLSTPAPPSRSRGLVMGAAVTACIAALAFVFVLRPANNNANVPAAGAAGVATPTVVAAPATASTPESELVEIHVAASPSNARLFVDDAPLPGNPFDNKFVRDGAVHRVRAEAPGFRSKTQLVAFKSDKVAVDFSLDVEPAAARRPIAMPVRPAPAAAPPPPPVAAAAAPKPAAPAPEVLTVPPPAPTPRVSIDTSDPYKK